MTSPIRNPGPPPDSRFVTLQRQAISDLSAARGHDAATRRAITAYLNEGYRLGLVSAELVDAFCVSTPNIIENAGFQASAAESLVKLFDAMHREFRRDHPTFG